MSRTYRRKNIERTLKYLCEGSKTNGYYTTYDYNDSGYKRVAKKREYFEDEVCIIQCDTVWLYTNGVKTYRAMTKEEARNRFRWLHGESSDANAWTPSRWYRKAREKRLRTRNKQELIRYMKNPVEYEPIVFENPQSHLWDWS